MKYLNVLLLTALLAACKQHDKVETLATDVPAAYQLCQAPELPKGLQLQMALDTTQANQLLFKLLIRNVSEEALSLDPAAANLLTQDLRRHQPLAASIEAQTLAPDEERLFSWQFQPVNDLYLYQHSGLYGSLQQRYQLPLTFIAGLKDTVTFCFPEEEFLRYSQREAQHKVTLYSPSPEALSPQAAARQETYYTDVVVEEVRDFQTPSTHFSDQEFFSAGVNVRHALYQQGDSLYLKLHIVNHAPHQLALDPTQILIFEKGEPQQPLRVERPQTATPGGTNTIRRGDRVPLMLVYAAPAGNDSLWVSLQGLQLEQIQKPLFGEQFPFIRQ